MPQRIEILMSPLGLSRYVECLSHFAKNDYKVRFTELNHLPTDLDLSWEKDPPDGIITGELKEWTDEILDLGIPTAVISRKQATGNSVAICVDDDLIGENAANYFLTRGFRNFAFLGDNFSYSKSRKASFVETVNKKGIDTVHTFKIDSQSLHYFEYQKVKSEKLQRWLLALPKPCAVFASNDSNARLICDLAIDSGIIVPQDLSILGVDNFLPLCLLIHPELSSIRIPHKAMGKTAVSALIQLMNGELKGGEVLTVPPEYIENRESSDALAIEDQNVCRALHWLRNNYHHSTSVELLCRELRLNRRQLERAFKKHLNCTPWDELCRLRIEKSKELLIRTRYPIERIAEESGFSEATYYASVFRKKCGISPSKFRRNAELEL